MCTDINTPVTSPSGSLPLRFINVYLQRSCAAGNAHGMPLAFLLGLIDASTMCAAFLCACCCAVVCSRLSHPLPKLQPPPLHLNFWADLGLNGCSRCFRRLVSCAQPVLCIHTLPPFFCVVALKNKVTREQLHRTERFRRRREKNYSVAWYSRVHHARHRQARHQQVRVQHAACVRALVTGRSRVIEEAMVHADPYSVRPLHVSFDIDACDPAFAPATGISCMSFTVFL